MPECETASNELKRERIPYQRIVDQFNTICKSLPEVQELTDRRKAAIRSRYKKYGEDKIIDVFRRAEESDWLSGRTQNRTWCNFDWIMKPSNFVKIIEGNYDNRGGGNGRNNESGANHSGKVPELFASEYI